MNLVLSPLTQSMRCISVFSCFCPVNSNFNSTWLLGYNLPINRSLTNSWEAEVWKWWWWAERKEKCAKEHLSCTALLCFQIRRTHMSSTASLVGFTERACPRRRTKDDPELVSCFPQCRRMAALQPYHLLWKGLWELHTWGAWSTAMPKGIFWTALWKKSGYNWGGGWITDMFHSRYKSRYCWIILTFPDEEVKGKSCFSST